MTDEKMRKSVADYCEEQDFGGKTWFIDGYDNSIVGITLDGRIIYDYEKMVDEGMRDGMTEEESRKWLDYNTLRSLPYKGDRAPIIMGLPIDEIKEMY